MFCSFRLLGCLHRLTFAPKHREEHRIAIVWRAIRCLAARAIIHNQDWAAIWITGRLKRVEVVLHMDGNHSAGRLAAVWCAAMEFVTVVKAQLPFF